MDKQPCVYILASRRNGTLYIGVTTDLAKRIYEHKHDVVEGFTKRYRVHTLVWFEVHESIETAIAREKAIKERKRKWKLALIEKTTHSGTIYIASCSDAVLDSGLRRNDGRTTRASGDDQMGRVF